MVCSPLLQGVSPFSLGSIATLDLVLTVGTVASEISQFFDITLELTLKMMRLVPRMILDDGMKITSLQTISDLEYYFHVQPLFF